MSLLPCPILSCYFSSMVDPVEDPLGSLRAVLRHPDQRTWRRFLRPPPGAHRAVPADGGEHHIPRVGEEDPPTRPFPAWQAGAGVLILAAGIVLWSGFGPVAQPPPAADGGLAGAGPPSAPPGDRTSTTSPTSTTSGTTAVRVWPAERVEVDGRVLRTDAGRWEVGAEGDLVTVGDWDCDRLPTPAVLRPADGRVAVFDRWASAGVEERARAVGLVEGAIGAEAGPRCGEVVVHLADGAHQTLDTQPPAAAVPGAGS